MKYKDITVGKNNYGIYYSDGIVMAADKQRTGYGYGGVGGGVYDKIYFNDGGPKEHVIEVQNWDIACREGHEMVFAWLIRQGAQHGSYIGFANKSTGEVYVNSRSIKKVFENSFTVDVAWTVNIVGVALFGGIGYILGSPFGYGASGTLCFLGIVAYIYVKITENVKFTKRVNQVQAEFFSLLNQKLTNYDKANN